MRPVAAVIFLSACLPTTIARPSSSSTSLDSTSWRRLSDFVVSRILSPFESRKSYTETSSANAAATSQHYIRDVVLRFNLSTPAEAVAIKAAAQDLYLDIWEYTEDWVDIRLAKDIVPSLINLLPASLSRSYAPLVPEAVLNSLITTPAFSLSSSRTLKAAQRGRSPNIFFSDYQPLSVIYPWFRLLANMFSTHVRVIKVGRSFEGRDILGLRVGTQRSDDEDKPAGPRKTVLIIGGLHAREWISVSSVNYLAYTLITQYGKKPIYTSMIDSFDWVFVPVTNPDGYEYTWSTDRLWRKNRQPTPLRFCHGIDLDRSFGFKFDQGTSGNPCSESYAGAEAWEAQESCQLRQWALNETSSGTEFVAFLDLHSYSQQILYPYAYSCDAEPPTLENLEELAFDLVRAMYHSAHGGSYKAVAACEGNVAVNADGKLQRLSPLESGGGSALDWFYEAVKVKFSYQIKLRDTGSYGFLLPKEEIVPTGREVVAAASYLGKFLLGEIGIMVDDAEGETDAKPDESREAGGPLREEPLAQHSTQMELKR